MTSTLPPSQSQSDDGFAVTVKTRSPGRPKDFALGMKRREDILEAATRLFAHRGFRNTDLKMVADELGVAKGTIYNYFESKNDLFVACVTFGMARLRLFVRARTRDISEPLELISCAVESYFHFFDEHPEVVELLVQERAEFKDRETSTYFLGWDEHKLPWLELFEKLKADGIFRDMSSEAVYEFMSNQVYGTLFANYFSGKKKPLASQTGVTLDILYRGILQGGQRSEF
ncbi:MAG TPA: TetR/AcrR family transcriptional regulator [Candidatus Obscuribacter sp.]|nr:TetR/AcrR family transcriptional regulator [Candidatus Obscuribacter sp.]